MRFRDGAGRHARLAAAAIVVLGFIAPQGIVSAQKAPLRLVSTAWPPFTNEPGQPRCRRTNWKAATRYIAGRSRSRSSR